MIRYTTIGVKDIEAAKKFYTELFDAEVLVDVCLLYTSPSPRD